MSGETYDPIAALWHDPVTADPPREDAEPARKDAVAPGRRRPAKTPPECYTDLEVQMFMRACSTRGRAGIRDRAMIAFMWRCGARCQETLDLMPTDIHWDRSSVTIASGKRRKPRVLGVDAQTLALLRTWEDCRVEIGAGNDSPFFCGIRTPGSQLATDATRKSFALIGEKSGVEKRLHAHGLRHSFAFSLLREGVPLDVISKALGHSNMKTTIEYLQHMHPVEVVETMQARDWEIERD